MGRERVPYARVSRRVWGDEKFLALSERARFLFLFLLTHPRGSAFPGLVVAGPASIAEDLGWKTRGGKIDVARAEDALRELTAPNGHEPPVVRDATAPVLWLRNALLHNPPANPNAVVAWARAIHDVPECPTRASAFRAAAEAVLGYGDDERDAPKIKREFVRLFAKQLPELLVQQSVQQLHQQSVEQLPQLLVQPEAIAIAAAESKPESKPAALLDIGSQEREGARGAAGFSSGNETRSEEKGGEKHFESRVRDLLDACERFWPGEDWACARARSWATTAVSITPLVAHAHEVELAVRKAKSEKRPIKTPVLYLPKWFSNVQAEREAEREKASR